MGAELSEERAGGGQEPSAEGEPRRLIGAISFDGVDCPIRRTDVHETYFAFDPPDGAPAIYTDGQTTNEQLIAFINQWLPVAKDVMGDVARRFRKNESPVCRYQTGDLAYVFGRPFMLRIYPQSRGSMRHASRGRANVGVRVVTEVSLIEVFVMQVDSYDQRRGSFMSWADGVLVRNGAGLFFQAAARAGIDLSDARLSFRAREIHDQLVRYDEKSGVVWLSRDLIPFPPMCCAYACARELARHAAPKDLAGEDREREVARLTRLGCPDWEQAREMLTDKDSVLRRQ